MIWCRPNRELGVNNRIVGIAPGYAMLAVSAALCAVGVMLGAPLFSTLAVIATAAAWFGLLVRQRQNGNRVLAASRAVVRESYAAMLGELGGAFRQCGSGIKTRLATAWGELDQLEKL